MNCRNVREILLARLDAPVAPAHEAALVEHLQICPDCGEEARQVQLSARWVRELPMAEPSENFEWRLKLRMAQATAEHDSEAREGGRSQGWGLRFAGTAAAAALVVVIAGAALFGPPEPGQPVQQPATAAGTTNVEPHRAGHPGLPTLAPRPAYMRIVPTSSGAPIGPYPTQAPAPSILGTADSDTAAVDR